MARETTSEFILKFDSMMSLGRCSERDSGISEQMLDEEETQVFENKLGLSQDLRFLAGMPELCDVMFLVGDERQPMYGVKAVLAIRSRVFYKMLYGPKSAMSSKHKITTSASPAANGPVAKKLQKMLSDASPLRHSPSRSSTTFGGGQQQKTTVCIEEFEPDVFKQLLEFVHTGTVTLSPRTLLGLMNAADHFAIEDLRKACSEFSRHCIKLDTVCSLLVTAERYIQYKSTKIFIQRVLEFVDSEGEKVLRLGEFVHLPRHVVELILSREELNATDLTKYRAVERWCRHYLLYQPHEQLPVVMWPFTKYIAFQQIPAGILMREIRPLGMVPDHMLMKALAYQADPASVGDSEGSGSPDLVSLTPRSRSRARLFELCSSAATSPVSTGAKRHILKSRSVDRNLSKCSTGSSGYESTAHEDNTMESEPGEKSSLLQEEWSSSCDGRTVLRIEPLEENGPPPPQPVAASLKSKSVSDLSSVSNIRYKL